jgi:hypothetical protein
MEVSMLIGKYILITTNERGETKLLAAVETEEQLQAAENYFAGVRNLETQKYVEVEK